MELRSIRRSSRGSVDWNVLCISHDKYCCNQSRSSRGSVDWNSADKIQTSFLYRRSSRGSVDWNSLRLQKRQRHKSRSSRGSVDWNIEIITLMPNPKVAPLVGAWIEIWQVGGKVVCVWVAPLVGAWIEIMSVLNTKPLIRRRSSRGSVDWNTISHIFTEQHTSLLSWERGLKCRKR